MNWISVNERLPAIGKIVFFYDSVLDIFHKGCIIRIGVDGKYQWTPSDRGKGYCGDIFNHITHWMLPLKPRDGENK